MKILLRLLPVAALFLGICESHAKYYDDETDLIHYGARYYSPNTGRWLSRDPIGEQGGLNLYGMVNNDPVNYFDPYGLYPINLVFNAFINGRRGTWLDEPMGGMRPSDLRNVYSTVQRQFGTDNRDFGQFSESARNARVFSIAVIDSEMIGKAKSISDLIKGISGAGDSHQRIRRGNAIFGTGSAGVGAPPPIIGIEWGSWEVQDPRTATVADGAPKVVSPDPCTTKITFTPSAKYPFVDVFGINPSPNINYEVTFTLKKRTDVSGANPPITVLLSGKHDNFPDYEGYVQTHLIYKRFSPASGPGLWSLGPATRVTIPDGTGLSLLGR